MMSKLDTFVNPPSHFQQMKPMKHVQQTVIVVSIVVIHILHERYIFVYTKQKRKRKQDEDCCTDIQGRGRKKKMRLSFKRKRCHSVTLKR